MLALLFQTLLKSDFLYFESKIVNDNLLEVQTFYDSNHSSTYASVKYSSEVI